MNKNKKKNILSTNQSIIYLSYINMPQRLLKNSKMINADFF